MTIPASGGDPRPLSTIRSPIVEDIDETVMRYQPRVIQFLRQFATSRTAVLGAIMLALIILMALLAPLITPGVTPDTRFNLPYLGFPEYGPTFDQFPVRLLGNTTGGPIFQYHSVLAGITYGARLTLIIGGLSAIFATIIGVILGAISGYFGGWLDALIMRVTDVVLALPFLPLVVAIIIASNLDTLDARAFVTIFALVGWAGVARLVRATYLTLREQEYAEAARATGVGHWRIAFRHLLPNAIAPIVVATTTNLAAFIIAEATVDFLDLGTSETGGSNVQTWGNMIAQAQSYILNGNWWWSFFPGLFILLTIVAVSLVGEGLRDALDVRGRNR